MVPSGEGPLPSMGLMSVCVLWLRQPEFTRKLKQCIWPRRSNTAVLSKLPLSCLLVPVLVLWWCFLRINSHFHESENWLFYCVMTEQNLGYFPLGKKDRICGWDLLIICAFLIVTSPIATDIMGVQLWAQQFGGTVLVPGFLHQRFWWKRERSRHQQHICEKRVTKRSN